MKKFLSLLICSLSLSASAGGGLIWYPLLQPGGLFPNNDPLGTVTLSMNLTTDINGTHPMLHIRGTQPGVNYLLIESTNMAQVSWDCNYWAKVPFQGDADVSVLLTNQCMFFRTQQLP